MKNLESLIKSKKAKVAVMGLGYVGLPHAVELAKAGFSVFGIDIKKKRVDKVNKGESYIGDVKDEELKRIVENDKLKAFNDFKPLREADAVLICVPTPLDKYKVPDISYIRKSSQEIKKRLKGKKLIILESTTYPGTTEEVILPMFEKGGLKVGRDFCLAFAPERINPGNKMPISNIPKVVGGVTKECTELSRAFYSQFLKSVYVVSSPKVAEMTKLLENAYRLVNISMVNELSLLCSKMGIDIWEVIEAAKTKPYGFVPFYPSPKIGGHCIPLDPFYLSYKAREYNFWARFIELAGEVNEQMPHSVVTRVNYLLNKSKKSISNSKILIWGIAYKKDVGDIRESAALDIIPDLIRKEAKVEYFDPFVKKLEIGGKVFDSINYSPEKLKEYDLVLILTDHSGFDYDEVAQKSRLVVDTRNTIKSRKYKNVLWL